MLFFTQTFLISTDCEDNLLPVFRQERTRTNSRHWASWPCFLRIHCAATLQFNRRNGYRFKWGSVNVTRLQTDIIRKGTWKRLHVKLYRRWFITWLLKCILSFSIFIHSFSIFTVQPLDRFLTNCEVSIDGTGPYGIYFIDPSWVRLIFMLRNCVRHKANVFINY